MRENISKRCNHQEVNLQNIQRAHADKQKKKLNQKMGRRSKQTLFQRRHTDGQKAYEKMLNIANHQRNTNQNYRDFPGSPMLKTSPSNAGGASSIPGQAAKIPHALRPKSQNIKQKQYCNKFSKDFKNGPHQKKPLKKKSKLQ